MIAAILSLLSPLVPYLIGAAGVAGGVLWGIVTHKGAAAKVVEAQASVAQAQQQVSQM
ncbi:hypothetical protein [Paraburkholderia sp. J12]|uniref:hypothetical protein n=1 Tax=Paraburkholderia sp. J12 TaxID=2805432 RepID=UPI002ABE8212|nr:hypothetical protein [Paraburkholderia sp. J12]